MVANRSRTRLLRVKNEVGQDYRLKLGQIWLRAPGRGRQERWSSKDLFRALKISVALAEKSSIADDISSGPIRPKDGMAGSELGRRIAH